MYSETASLAEEMKSIVHEQEESFLKFRGVDDNFVKSLADYLAEHQQESIVESISFIECSITGNSIRYLLEKYGSKLQELNIPSNCLSDKDLASLQFPKTLKSLDVSDNYLSVELVDKLKGFPFENLDVEGQKQLSDTVSNKSTISSLLFNKQGGGSADTSVSKQPDLLQSFLNGLSALPRSEQLNIIKHLAISSEALLKIKIEYKFIGADNTLK